MRTPAEIAAEAQALADVSAAQSVPLSLDKVALLSIDFMVAVAALIAAGTPAV